MNLTSNIKDKIAFFCWDGKRFVVTLGLGNNVIATFKTIKETRAFVEAHNAALV